MDLVSSSYQFCLSNLQSEISSDTFTSTQTGSYVTENVVRLRVKEEALKHKLLKGVHQLQMSVLMVDCFGLEDIQDNNSTPNSPSPNKPLSCQITVLCNDIQLAMNKLHYAIHRGEVYKLNKNAVYSYKHLCPIKAFLNSLMGNEAFKDRLVQHIGRLLPIFNDPECCLLHQLKIEKDLVEVNDEWFWSFKERKFVHGVIPKSQAGLMSPRAFLAYDKDKEPDPGYFRDILTNSLSEDQVKMFCKDFIALFQPKLHKQPVPCSIGASDSGKTSLFAPIFSIVPLHKIARVTKQKSFNKAMIDEATEIIFLDEAQVKLMDIDDWKILCQGGFTSHDSKWKKARGFNSTATMYITGQTELDFGDDHNPAMDRRLNKYFFQSLPNVVPEAHQWLKQHAMDVIVWASQQIENSETATLPLTDTQQSGLTSDEIENILNVQLTDDRLPSGDADSNSALSHEDNETEDVSEDDEIVELLHKMTSSEYHSLRYRQLELLLKEKLKEKKTLSEMKRRRLQRRRSELVELGIVSGSQAEALINDPDGPLPSYAMQEKLENAMKERREREEAQKKKEEREKTKCAFENDWLLTKEREMVQLSDELLVQEPITNERRAVIKSLLEITIHKVKTFHEKQGTISLACAVEERKKKCVALNLVDQCDTHLVTDVYSPLPVTSSLQMMTTPPKSPTELSDDDLMYYTPKTPSYSPSYSQDYCSPSMWVPSSSQEEKKRKRKKKQSPNSDPAQKKITDSFHST